MNNKKTNFANGYNYFCTDCGIFFSVSVEADVICAVKYCFCCAEDNIISSTEELLEYCNENDTDPVNFYKAFPLYEKIPQSCTGATPHEVSTIINLVGIRKQKALPLTVEIITLLTYFNADVVKKVFEELHITEKGGEK